MIDRFRAALTRRQDYKHTFLRDEVSQRVLADLLRRTKANTTVFHANNDRQNAFLQGRQSVIYEILDWLNMTDQQIEALRRKELPHD